jgi:hypothetical protein
MELFDSLLDDETLLRRQNLPVAAAVPAIWRCAKHMEGFSQPWCPRTVS